MKRIALTLITAAAALAAHSARADTRVHVGVNLGGPVFRPAPPVVVYAPPPPVVVTRAPVVVAPRGYWKEVQVKTWVPERWFVRHNRWGRAERVCEPGYYTYRTDRVWVDGRHDRDYRDHRDSHDHRGYSYGYHRDNGRRDDNRGGWNR